MQLNRMSLHRLVLFLYDFRSTFSTSPTCGDTMACLQEINRIALTLQKLPFHRIIAVLLLDKRTALGKAAQDGCKKPSACQRPLVPHSISLFQAFGGYRSPLFQFNWQKLGLSNKICYLWPNYYLFRYEQPLGNYGWGSRESFLADEFF